MKLTAEIDLSKEAGSRCFGPRFTTFLHGVQQFAAPGDVIVGGSQNIIACGVWSLVRMSLLVSILMISIRLSISFHANCQQAAVNTSSCLESLSMLFMEVGRSAPRY